jgi:hypothetical protein
VARTGSRPRVVHRDGRPFTAAETGLIGSAAEDDLRAAAGELAAAPERLAEPVAPYLRAVAEDRGHPGPPAQAP